MIRGGPAGPRQRLETPIILASGSLRRRRMLEAAGVSFEVEPPLIDDGLLTPSGASASAWAMAMSFLKSRWVAETRLAAGQCTGTVLGADTVCCLDGRIMGQPAGFVEAAEMLRSFREREHDVITGVTLIDLRRGERVIFHDRALVRWGRIADDRIEEYLAGGQWRGKAGGYNLADRIEAGWEIECVGDPATVMGLPMKRIMEMVGRV